MSSLARVKQREQFYRFVDGETFASAPPIKLAVFDAADVQKIKAYDFEVAYQTQDSWNIDCIRDQAVSRAVRRSSALFSRHVMQPTSVMLTGVGTKVETRYGMFSEGMLRNLDLSGFHLDSGVGLDDEFAPVSVISAVIGAPTMAFYGLARRIDDQGNVQLLEGEVDHLENGIYLFPSTAVHAEALLPEVPEARFFWRKVH